MNDVNEQESFIPHGHRGNILFNCFSCKDRGAVLATMKGDGRIYAFTCTCTAGARRGCAFPVFPGEAAGWEVAA